MNKTTKISIDMENDLLAELKELRFVIAKLVGSSDFPLEEQFSFEKVEKAAKEFKGLLVKRGEWIAESDLPKYLKGAPYGIGKFIREEFNFSNYYKQGQSFFYNRKDAQALAKVLKDRNIHIGRYIELKADQENFKKKIASAALSKRAAIKKLPYSVPNNLCDIPLSDSPKPQLALIKDDLKNLKNEFFEYKLAEYVDIYKNSYAMVKFEYSFSKYYPDDVKRRCKSWCERFNYANHALELLTQKRDKFIPVKDEDMFEL